MVRNDMLVGFAFGLSIGILIAVINSEFNLLTLHASYKSSVYIRDVVNETDYYMHNHAEEIPKNNVNDNFDGINFNFRDENEPHHLHGDVLARKMSKENRVLCWVMTSPKTLFPKAAAVNNTWGKRCNILLFMSSVEDKSFPAVGLDVPEGRENLWLKTRASWTHVYKHYFDKADWFIKADDDTFVIVENLRYLVSIYDTEKDYYFGRHFKTFGGYESGGAGYVFSKGTLKKFIKIMEDPEKCHKKAANEDVEVGKCLQAVNIHPTDSRDNLGRERFHPFAPNYHLIPGSIENGNWLHQYSNYPVVTGPDCCSDFSVTFHYVVPNQMYLLEYYIYHLTPYGINHVWDVVNTTKKAN